MEQGRIWHVTLTVGGAPTDATEVRSALDRLATEQPFLLGARYDSDRCELDYWEEAEGCEDAAALALRLWGEHRASAGLPAWSVLGLEVVERDTFARRGGSATPPATLVPAGRPRPVRLRSLPG